MLRRLFVGLLIGLVIGGLMAFALVKGLNAPVFNGASGALLAYLFAGLSGVVTGLLAGKPIWARGGQIEAGLKALFGALLAVGAMFALRQWGGGIDVNLAMMSAGHAAIGDLPAASLPLIAAILGGFYELDNTVDESETRETRGAQTARRVASSAKGAPRGSAADRAAPGQAKSRVVAELPDVDDDLDAPSGRAKR